MRERVTPMGGSPPLERSRRSELLHVRLGDTLAKTIRRVAHQRRITRSELVREALLAYITNGSDQAPKPSYLPTTP